MATLMILVMMRWKKIVIEYHYHAPVDDNDDYNDSGNDYDEDGKDDDAKDDDGAR